MIAVAPLFSSLEDWTIYTHRKPVLQKRLVVFRFTVPVENPDIGIPAKGNRGCLRFQTPDFQDEDLTYV